jgi:hypothetical protein
MLIIFWEFDQDYENIGNFGILPSGHTLTQALDIDKLPVSARSGLTTSSDLHTRDFGTAGPQNLPVGIYN